MKTIRCKNNFGEFVNVDKEKFFFRPSAYAIIIKNQEILTLTNKSNNKLWFPGGGIEIGEKIEDGLKREVKEETDLSIKIGKMVLFKENFFYYQPLDEAYHAFLFFFICKTKNKKLIADKDVNDLESGKPRWTKISSLTKNSFGDLSEELYKLINTLK
ncbi:MAG: NUDIX domain-containing protein [Patescibacteria group bacterium]|jgi:ADP-ribose pyrophosphatase YjhB (NUDIX family)